jgi:acyl carrier protein
MQADEIKMKLKRFILDDVLHRSDLELEDDTCIISSGLVDSFAALEIAIFTEKTFKVELTDDEYADVDSINDVANLVLKAKKVA